MTSQATDRPEHRPSASVDQAQLEHRLALAARMGLGFWEWDVPSGAVRSLNGPAEFLASGVEGAPATSTGWAELVHPEDLLRAHQAYEPCLRGVSDDWGATLRLRLADGRWQSMQVGGRVVARDGQGLPLRVLGVVQDSNRQQAEQVALEQERLQLEQQLFQAQKMETMGTLAGGIAHDFNNILTAILVHSELGLSGQLSASRASEAFAQIHQASLRARELVKRILTFTRPQEPERRLVSATELLRDAAKFSRAIVPSTMDLQLEIVGQCGEIWVDTNQFHQLVLNLVSNAAQAMSGSQGRVSFKLEPCELSEPRRSATGLVPVGEYYVLTVSDQGRGMSSETRQRAFEPFFTTKRAGEGTGLGLSIVQGIVQSHGGGIELSSEPGAGATFVIYWPAAEAGASPESAPASGSARRGRGQRVLIVDDEAAVALAARRALESLGYAAKAVTSAEEFFSELASRQDYELALIDHTMPRLTGLAVALQLREQGNQLPIIIASGDGRHLTSEALSRLGHSSALRKPYEMEQLAEAVYRHLGKRRSERA